MTIKVLLSLIVILFVMGSFGGILIISKEEDKITEIFLAVSIIIILFIFLGIIFLKL